MQELIQEALEFIEAYKKDQKHAASKPNAEIDEEKGKLNADMQVKYKRCAMVVNLLKK